MKITSDLFQAFLKCPTKCWLRAVGEPGSGNAYADWVKSQTASYVATQTARLLSESPKDESAVSPALENFKGGEWRLATDMVIQAELNSYSIESKLHAIERIPPEGRGRPAKFVPLRFISTNKLGRDDKLLLAFDTLVLSEAVAREINVGKIIHGDGQELIVKYQKRFERYRESLFVFLERDGVPWNNNAAERALRHLAVQRKISGAFSSKGAQDYIRLLGVAQSCRFQEKSFLGFLRSGLTDVDAFKKARSRRKR